MTDDEAHLFRHDRSDYQARSGMWMSGADYAEMRGELERLRIENAALRAVATAVADFPFDELLEVGPGDSRALPLARQVGEILMHARKALDEQTHERIENAGGQA